MSLREECDAAEVVWGALEDRRDTARLLAWLLVAQGAKSLRDYEPPSVRLVDELAGIDTAAGDRQAEVMRFIAATGEAG